MARPERTLRVEAIILQHSDWGEADRILRLFTREQGKLRAIAKGARKMKSRKAGHLEPFMRSKLMLAKGRDMWIVTQAEVIDPYTSLRENLELTARAAYVIELLDRLTYEEGQNWQLYDLVTKTLTRDWWKRKIPSCRPIILRCVSWIIPVTARCCLNVPPVKRRSKRRINFSRLNWAEYFARIAGRALPVHA